MTKHVHLTWYILADGTQADPNDCSPDKDGVLRHKNGVAVALGDNGVPLSIGRAAVIGGNVAAAAGVTDPAAITAITESTESKPAKDIKPATAKRGYKTRESKAR